MNLSLDTQLNVQDDYLVLKVKAVREPSIRFNIEFNDIKVFGALAMAIKAGNQVKISIDPRDAFGNKARVENTVWQLNDPSLGALQPSSDGVSVVFSSIGKVGQAVVEVAADADLSDGIRNIAGSVAIDIEPGEAVDLGVFVEPIVMAVAPVVEEPVAPVTEVPADTTDTATTEAPATETTSATEAPVDIVEATGVSGEPTGDLSEGAADGIEEQPIV